MAKHEFKKEKKKRHRRENVNNEITNTKGKKIIKIILFSIFLLIFVFSGVNLLRWFIFNQKAATLTNEIIDSSFIEENIEVKENDIPKNPIDFNSLEEQNSDTVAWIRINGTNINYPIVQSTNNDYYLHRDFNKEYSTCGWIFMDYKNTETMIDKNTVLYGHNIKSGIMFSELKNILNKKLGEDDIKIEIYTPTEKLEYVVFSAYLREPDDYAIKSNIVKESDQEKYINEMIRRSNNNYKWVPDKTDRLLTLSTCDNSGQNRILIHSVYIDGETYTK